MDKIPKLSLSKGQWRLFLSAREDIYNQIKSGGSLSAELENSYHLFVATINDKIDGAEESTVEPLSQAEVIDVGGRR